MIAPPAIPTVKPLVFRDVVTTAAIAFDIDAARIMAMGTRKAARARWAVWLALTEQHGWTQPQIARRFDCDHTTVGHGLRQARKLWGAK